MITIEDLKSEIGDYQYGILTNSDVGNGERAITKARVWIVSRFSACGKSVTKKDFGNELVKEAHLKRAIYELYSIREQEEKAKDKKEDALELLAGYLGTCVYKGVEASNSGDNNSGCSVVVVRGSC